MSAAEQLFLLDVTPPGGAPAPLPFDECSEDGRYRYQLGLRWGPGPLINFLLVNPSIATRHRPDPTWTRCLARARALAAREDLGAPLLARLRRRGIPGGVVLTNLFALVSSKPKVLRTSADPVGPGNDRHIHEVAKEAALVICAWGNAGALLGRGAAVRRDLETLGIPLHALMVTKKGHPQHPLFLPYDLEPFLWQ